MHMDFEIRNVRQFRQRIPGRLILRVLVIGVFAVMFLFTTWFTVEPEEAGIVLRFGRFARQAPSGLHMKLPYPFERVLKVPVERQLKEEFGFRTKDSAAVRTTYSAEDLTGESL